MPEAKDTDQGLPNQATPNQATQGKSNRTAQASAAQRSSTAESEGRSSDTMRRRMQQYLIGSRLLPGIPAQPIDTIIEALGTMKDVEVVRRLRPQGFQGFSVGGATSAHDIIVVRMDEQRSEALRQSAPSNIVVEIDAPLTYMDVSTTLGPLHWHMPAQVLPLPGPRADLRIRILGGGDQPVAGASIYVFGSAFPFFAVTDGSGLATVTTHDPSIRAGTIRAIYVRPAADYWDRFIPDPQLGDDTNTITLTPFNETFPKFPSERLAGWGQRLMNLAQRAGTVTGAGIKIGLIDSGCDSTHPLLGHVTRGVNLTDSANTEGWKDDEIGHGTHCAGIITGRSQSGQGIVGFAPGAELHVFKVFPGGRFSDLIDVLDQCIERQLDIVNLSLGCDQISELVTQKIVEARQKGVACITAAGNSGGLVQFPGIVPGVLTVSAIGKLGEFPPDSYHAQTILREGIGPGGVFATNFSCYGPQVAVSAPGVAIISSVPGGGYAARDGTSIAAAHAAGFAAIVLAHHPLFQGAARSEQRVAALFEIMRASAVPYVQADPARVGAGVPDLQRVPGMPVPSEQAGQRTKQFGVEPGPLSAWFAYGGRFGEQAQPGLQNSTVPPAYAANAVALMQRWGGTL